MPATLALFIAYLFERSYASSTVNTYISAIGYSHKLSGLFDPTRVFYIIQMLKGCGKSGSRLDSRLPITLPILKNLLEVSPRINGSHYQICQFKAMCSLAFFAFLRIGEITSTNNPGCHPLQLNQLAYNCDSSNHVLSIRLTFHNFKHNYNQRPFQLTITRQPACCPVQLLLEYLALRGNREGAIFMTPGGRTWPERYSLLSCLKQYSCVAWTQIVIKDIVFVLAQLRTQPGRVCLIHRFG